MSIEDYMTSRKKYELRNKIRQNKIEQGEIQKHIIIAGVPRTGKTTTCMKLGNSNKYQHICMDAVVSAFEQVYPRIRNYNIYKKSR